MKIIDVVQGTPEWHATRLGRLTASRLGDALATTKAGWGASRANLIAQLVAERLTGVAAEAFTNDAMRWGSETEAEARAAYEFARNVDVELVGFVEHPTISMAGASPDGLVGRDGLVELKAPNTATHIETLLGASLPRKYDLQAQWQMACTGRLWVDHVSFDPRMPSDMQLHIRRVARLPDAEMRILEQQVVEFLAEVDGKVAKLTEQFRKAAA